MHVRRAPEVRQLGRLDRPAAAAGVAGLVAIVFVAARLAVAAHGRIAAFIMLERAWVVPGHAPPGIPVLPDNGYDGQFFYRLARGPFDFHRVAFGITFDTPFRNQRDGYPLLAWLASVGHATWVPTTLVLVNVAAVAAVAAVGAVLARDAGRHALWGLLAAAYFGFVLTLGRDTAELVAAAMLLGALLAYRRDRFVLAGALLAYGSLCRETDLVAAGAVALVRFAGFARRRARPGREDVVWVLPAVAFLAWQVAVHQVIGVFPLLADTSSNAGLPSTVISAIGEHVQRALQSHTLGVRADYAIWLLELATLLTVIACALAVFRQSETPPWEKLALVAYTVEMFFLAKGIWDSNSDLRSLYSPFLLAVVVLLGARRAPPRPLAALVVVVLVVVLAHRVVSL